jgi:hypothetical protein
MNSCFILLQIIYSRTSENSRPPVVMFHDERHKEILYMRFLPNRRYRNQRDIQYAPRFYFKRLAIAQGIQCTFSRGAGKTNKDPQRMMKCYSLWTSCSSPLCWAWEEAFQASFESAVKVGHVLTDFESCGTLNHPQRQWDSSRVLSTLATCRWTQCSTRECTRD